MSCVSPFGIGSVHVWFEAGSGCDEKGNDYSSQMFQPFLTSRRQPQTMPRISQQIFTYSISDKAMQTNTMHVSPAIHQRFATDAPHYNFDWQRLHNQCVTTRDYGEKLSFVSSGRCNDALLQWRSRQAALRSRCATVGKRCARSQNCYGTP